MTTEIEAIADIREGIHFYTTLGNRLHVAALLVGPPGDNRVEVQLSDGKIVRVVEIITQNGSKRVSS